MGGYNRLFLALCATKFIHPRYMYTCRADLNNTALGNTCLMVRNEDPLPRWKMTLKTVIDLVFVLEALVLEDT